MALVLRFRGRYRPGSQGKPDAACLAAHAAAALEAWDCDAVVFDLGALDYRWGDGLVRVFAVEGAEGWLPRASAVVLGPGSRDGLQSLCNPRVLFEAVDDAVVAALAEARARRAMADALEAEPLLIVLAAHLAAERAAETLAFAMACAVDTLRRTPPMAAWLAGEGRVEVRAGDAEDLAWAAGLPSRHVVPGQAVVLAPRLPRPDRLDRMRRYPA